MILQVSNGRVEFAGEVLFEHADFVIKNKNDKIAIVGRNGCGKTTFLKVISGQLQMTQHENDAPSVLSRTGNPSIGYLKQISFEDENLTVDKELTKAFDRIIRMQKRLQEMVEEMEGTVEDEAAHAALIEEYTRTQETFTDLGGYYYVKEYDTMLKKFGFTQEDKQKKLSEFSGGQRTKLAFIKLLLSKPEVLLLDEPTNHLDITAIEWLETFLKNYPYAIVLVSHDRMFLDRIVDTVYEIEHGTMKRYAGNYTAFVKRKKEDYERQLSDYNRQQAEIKRLSDLAEKMKHHPTKVSMAHSKEKAIEHMDKIDSPDKADTRVFHFNLSPRIVPGKDILSISNLTIGYDAAHPLCTVNLEIKRGQRLGILGGNGLGKSTLLKTLTGAIEPLSGEYRYGVHVETGYFDQQMAQYSSEKTVLDDFWDAYPKLMQQDVRSALGAFLFTQEEVYKTVNMLSGGEKVRVALAKIFQNRPNVLILDEPTNHMDLPGKEALEEMLRKYEGTVIFVSHDRYFVSRVADTVLEILPGEAKYYPFGYEDYLERTGQGSGAEETGERGGGRGIMSTLDRNGRSAGRVTLNGSASDQAAASGDGVMSTTKAQDSYRAGKELSRLQKKLQKIEEELVGIEAKVEADKDRLQDPALASDYVKLQEIQEEIDAGEEKILGLMEEYEKTDEEIRSLTS